MNRSLSQLSYRPENMNIIAMNAGFVKAFFSGTPAQKKTLRGGHLHYTPSLLRRMISASSGVVVEV